MCIRDRFTTVQPTSAAVDACGNSTGRARYAFINLGIDDSNNFTFPDDTSADGSHTTISGINWYFHPQPANRLRMGQTFTDNLKSNLDANP